MIRFVLVLALLGAFALYTAKPNGFRELGNEFRGIKDKLTVMMEALQP